MTCDRHEALSAYADGQGATAERDSLRRHLEACVACRRQLRWLQAMKTNLAELPVPELPLALRSTLRVQAREAAARRQARLRSERWGGWAPRLRPRALAGLGAAGLALAAALIVLKPAPSETVPLDEMLAAHRAYALTLPLASQEGLLPGLADALVGSSRP